MKKVLITGGAGYIGGYMTEIFTDKEEYDITVYDNLLYETRYLKDVNFIYGDIRDTGKMGKIINDYDIIIWLAAIVGDGACAVNEALSEDINFNTVKWLVDNYTKGTIIFTSTCSVYGMNKNLIDEEAKPNPLSVYAATKLQAEQYIVKNAKDYVIFRLGTLYGIGDSHSRLRFDLVVNILTLRAVQGESLTVFGGQQWRPILHVRDVAYATLYCIENNIRGLFNLSELNVEISELSGTIKRLLPETKVIYQDMKFEDLRDYKVKNNRFLETGWKPRFSLDEGILEMIKVFSEGRVKNLADPVYSNVEYLSHIDFGNKVK